MSSRGLIVRLASVVVASLFMLAGCAAPAPTPTASLTSTPPATATSSGPTATPPAMSAPSTASPPTPGPTQTAVASLTPATSAPAPTASLPTGPPATPTPTAAAVTDPPLPVPVVTIEQGFAMDPGGEFLTWAAILENPNSDRGIYQMLVLIDFLAADGTFIAGAEPYLTLVPHQRSAIVGQVYVPQAPRSMVVRPPDDATAYLPYDRTGSVVIDVNERRQTADGFLTKGRATNRLGVDQSYLQVIAVYRDAAGDLVGGTTAGIEQAPAGRSVPFEIFDGLPPSRARTSEAYWMLGGTLP